MRGAHARAFFFSYIVLHHVLTIYIHKSKAWVYRAPSEVTRNSLNLELRDCYHRICRQILLKNAGITFPLAHNLEIQYLVY